MLGGTRQPTVEVLDAGLGSLRYRGLWAVWGGGSRSHYLLRLTGRLSLVCACFLLLQPVRLYWWWPRLPTGGLAVPLPTEL